jgi:hypothetical protein
VASSNESQARTLHSGIYRFGKYEPIFASVLLSILINAKPTFVVGQFCRELAD